MDSKEEIAKELNNAMSKDECFGDSAFEKYRKGAELILAREKKLLRDIKKELFEWAKKEGFLDNNSFTFPANQIIDKKLKERE